MKVNFQETIKQRTDKELETILKKYTSYSAEERLASVNELEERGIWRDEFISLKKNLKENIRDTKKNKQKALQREKENYAGPPMTFAEGMRDITVMKILKVLLYNCIVFQDGGCYLFPSHAKAISRAHMLLCTTFILPPSILFDFVAMQLGFETNAVGIMLLMGVIVFPLFYFLLVFDGKAEKIYNERPTLFNSHKVSKIFTAVFITVPFVIMILAMLYLAITK
jgi:hypothetical protein